MKENQTKKNRKELIRAFKTYNANTIATRNYLTIMHSALPLTKKETEYLLDKLIDYVENE